MALRLQWPPAVISRAVMMAAGCGAMAIARAVAGADEGLEAAPLCARLMFTPVSCWTQALVEVRYTFKCNNSMTNMNGDCADAISKPFSAPSRSLGA